MLVTNPAARAPLSEVLTHPWMLRGFNGPPESHLVHREPLRADELDKQVIRGMKGFEFGSEEDIERKLTQVLESDAYVRAMQAWERKRDGRNGHGRWGESISNSSLAISFDGTSTTNRNSPHAVGETEVGGSLVSTFIVANCSRLRLLHLDPQARGILLRTPSRICPILPLVIPAATL
jgi:hypothetical protein